MSRELWTAVDGYIGERLIGPDPALAAALSAMEELRRRKSRGEKVGDVRLIFTRAEEIGFIGAIAACKHKSVSKKSRLICLENSRSFAESPIGAGKPHVRQFAEWVLEEARRDSAQEAKITALNPRTG